MLFRTYFFGHQDLGIHLPQLCPQLMNHSIYKPSVFMAQRVGFVYIIKANKLVLFKERFGFRCENHSQDICTVFDKGHESRTVAVDCPNSYQWCVNGQTKMCLIELFSAKS